MQEPRLYSYIVASDCGSAPNPFWGTCTLAICKPKIRKNACVQNWVIGTGSKNSRLKSGKTDLSDRLVYAMKITDKMTLEEYDRFCRENLRQKIPNWSSHDYRKQMGDCIYDYPESGEFPSQREGVHNESNRKSDLGGENVLLSEEFYYFGESPVEIPQEFKGIVHTTQGHKICKDTELIKRFEGWIGQFEKNKVYAESQLKHEIAKTGFRERCSKEHKKEDEEDREVSC